MWVKVNRVMANHLQVMFCRKPSNPPPTFTIPPGYNYYFTHSVSLNRATNFFSAARQSLTFETYGDTVTTDGGGRGTYTNHMEILHSPTTIKANGIITKWTFYNAVPNKVVRFIVIRPNQSFLFVGWTSRLSSSKMGPVTFTSYQATTPLDNNVDVIKVKKGDIIGMYYEDVNPVSYTVVTPTSVDRGIPTCSSGRIWYSDFGSMKITTPSAPQLTFPFGVDPCRTYSIQVEILTTGRLRFFVAGFQTYFLHF